MRKYIAALDAATAKATSWNPRVKIRDSEALALAVSGGTVYVGGSIGLAQFGFYPITTAPNKLEFGTLPVGATSLSKILTVTNMLESNLLIDSILLTGPDAEDFIVQSDLCSGTTLPPSGNCTVDVAFSPSSTVSKSAYVTISSNMPTSWTFDVPITGAGGTPRVNLLSPNGGEVIPSGPTYDITWWAPSRAVEFKLQYSTDNGATWETIASHLSGMTHGWEVPALQNNKKACLVRVTGYDDSGVKVGSDKSDDTIYNRSGFDYCSDSGRNSAQRHRRLSRNMDYECAISENVSSATVFYTLGNSGIWKEAAGTVMDPLTGFSWDVPSPVGRKNAKLKVVFRDGSGNKVATAISRVFRIE